MFKLKNIYAPLKTSWLSPKERKRTETKVEDEKRAEMAGEKGAERPLADLLGQIEVRHFVVEGQPGSGKSTFVRHSALTEVAKRGGRLPLLLSLRDFGTWLRDHPGDQGGQLLAWAGKELDDWELDPEALKQRSGRGRLLWLLDGLDEIFDEGVRLRAAKIIGRWFSGKGKADTAIVTSRPPALKQKSVRPSIGWAEGEAPVLPLNKEDQRVFVEKWCLAVYEDKPIPAKALSDNLWTDMERQGLVLGLRDNPLMLSTMATIYHQGKYLPERRTDLYEKAIEVLLEQRFGASAGGGPERTGEMWRCLMSIARGMHERGAVREIPQIDYLYLIQRALFGDCALKPEESAQVEKVALQLGSHSGLLGPMGEPPVYKFLHLGFQEYLVAKAYAREKDLYVKLSPKLENPAWREVILLVTGFLFQSGVSWAGEDFLQSLANSHKKAKNRVERMGLAVWAASEASRGSISNKLEASLKGDAVALLEKGEGEVKTRIELAKALGRLGDPRFGPTDKSYWVKIEPGTFTMGDDDGPYDDEKPVHKVTISKPFYVARVPVTNEQYRRFMDAGGYINREWWRDEGWRWLNLKGKAFDEWYAAENEKAKTAGIYFPDRKFLHPSKEPLFWRDGSFNSANQPVVGINWHEAEAYCGWLTAHLAGKNLEWWKDGFKVILPSEAQWEYSARGRESRKYTWGKGEPDEEKTNYKRNIIMTTPVGCYPKGANPEGVLDLAGNVWEWCRDTWDEKAYRKRGEEVQDPLVEAGGAARVVRGSSWSGDAVSLRAACRLGSYAGYRFNVVGFRCALSSASPDCSF